MGNGVIVAFVTFSLPFPLPFVAVLQLFRRPLLPEFALDDAYGKEETVPLTPDGVY